MKITHERHDFYDKGVWVLRGDNGAQIGIYLSEAEAERIKNIHDVILME